jgi:hypothetical protein
MQNRVRAHNGIKTLMENVVRITRRQDNKFNTNIRELGRGALKCKELDQECVQWHASTLAVLSSWAASALL